MFDSVLDIYIYLITNIELFLKNPVNSTTIDVLRIFSIILFIRFLVKVFLHSLIFTRLKKKFISYEDYKNRYILDLFYSNCRKVKLRKIPSFITFSEEKPLIFSIGILRPAVFLSPRLIFDLSREEMEAAILHELYHIKSRDSLWLGLFEFFLIFIPVITIILFGHLIVFEIIAPYLFIVLSVSVILLFSKFVKQRFVFYRELECDDSTISLLKDPLLLASAIVKVWRIGRKLQKFNYLFSLFQVQPFITASQKVEVRIKRLTDYKGPSKRIFLKRTLFFATALIVLFSFVFLWDFSSVYKKTSIETQNGKILLKYIKNPEKHDVNIKKEPGKNPKRKYIFKTRK